MLWGFILMDREEIDKARMFMWLSVFVISTLLLLITFYLFMSADNECTSERNLLDGINLRGYDNWTEVYDKVIEEDAKGDWVCVNVNGMSFERAVEVCNHEVGHEIFAEFCEKNMDKCVEMTK